MKKAIAIVAIIGAAYYTTSDAQEIDRCLIMEKRMKNVLAYKGFPQWIFNPSKQNSIACRLQVRQTDGTYKDTIVNDVIKNDAWTGSIETEDSMYYHYVKETV
jgi:hypothetical protein